MTNDTASRPAPRGLDEATTALLAGSLRELFGTTSTAQEVASALDELGWSDVRADDPTLATTLLFTEQGRALASSRQLDDVLLTELAAEVPASGAIRALGYPLESGHGALLLAPLDGVDEVVLPTAGGYNVRPAADLSPVPVHGFDPAGSWFTIEDTADPKAPGWKRGVAAGHRAIAAEIIGVCEAALQLATDHTSGRVQYGRPIASFQAVRHRIAEAYVAVVATRRLLATAWEQAADPVRGPWTAAQAKIRAGRAQADVLRTGVQVLGAMGVSQESPMHHHVSRGAALDFLLGSSAALLWETGAALLDGAPADPVTEI